MQGQIAWPPLTQLGVAQAHAAAETLAPRAPTRVMSSDLRRASDTAAIIGRRLGVTVEHAALLRERCWGIFEAKPVDEGHRAASLLSAEEPVPQGESRSDVAQRLRLFMTGLTAVSGPVVVVTHGDVIREAIELWSPEREGETDPVNGCVIPILVDL